MVNYSKSVLIVGASGGLGTAIAQRLAGPDTLLVLWGRDLARLQNTATLCSAAGAVTQTRSLDLRDIAAALAAIAADDAATPFDMVVFAQGRGDIRAADDRVEQPGLVTELALVNFTGPATLAAAMGQAMAARGKGCIVVIGSAAGFHSLPFATAYAGTKAGLARFADALRLALRGHGVSVTLVSPGFIDTAAGRQVPGPKPMLMAPDEVADRIVRAAEQGRAHLVLPWPFVVLRWLDRLLPRAWHDRLLLSLAPPA
ncbi:SDR family NAD(P)-dependent oxidoreductase [Novosphingobium capsulatum]|uniref:SDR family NAD(P)-dependent oxidoreductase n=1 Tax=Novosphingobium capsulatum TaxID=13688 RepID=UPI000789335C|nr:SDR family NAD(P)-dependent oxidoreductase [Novosphingobium capsulatum]WQD94164.1 SDR family NAD(P)-dependent oxidoreductase [Novosphingobium capsulatum]